MKVARGLEEPLFSITCELSNGAKLASNKNNNLVLKYEDGRDIIFDCRFKTRDGWVAGVELCPSSDETEKTAKVVKKTSTKIKHKDVNELHAELGNPSKDVTRATGTSLGYKMMEKLLRAKTVPSARQNKPRRTKYQLKGPKRKVNAYFWTLACPRRQALAVKSIGV